MRRKKFIVGKNEKFYSSAISVNEIKANNFNLNIGDKVILERFERDDCDRHKVKKQITGTIQAITDWFIVIDVAKYCISVGKMELYINPASVAINKA